MSRINNEIDVIKVQVINEDGLNLGIQFTSDAIITAMEDGLDLVEIVPKSSPPVCKMMNYSKNVYAQEKKTKNMKKKQNIKTKTIRLSPNIDVHDLKTKANQINKFIEAGHKVQIILKFRGRMNDKKELGFAVINNLVNNMLVNAKVGWTKQENDSLVTLLISDKVQV